VVVVESASEKFFSAGADIKAFLANDPDTNMEMIRAAHASLSWMATSPKLFTAWISGHALGGGLEIALACDLRYGAEDGYRLGTPEVTLGLLPGNGGTQRLPRLIGLGPALDLLLTGRQLSPAEAKSIGLLSGTFASREEFDSHVERLAAGPPLAIANIKRAAYEGTQMRLEDALALERDLIDELFRSGDAREGLTAFTEKRAPAFTGA
jgi:enoyl-CoA hydratase/carnithine racemase